MYKVHKQHSKRGGTTSWTEYTFQTGKMRAEMSQTITTEYTIAIWRSCCKHRTAARQSYRKGGLGYTDAVRWPHLLAPSHLLCQCYPPPRVAIHQIRVDMQIGPNWKQLLNDDTRLDNVVLLKLFSIEFVLSRSIYVNFAP